MPIKQPNRTKKSTNKYKNTLTYINYSLGLLAAIALTIFVANQSFEESNPELKVVVVNSVELTKAQMINLDRMIKEDEELDTGLIELEATKFAQAYVKALDMYRKDGYIILDSKQALGWPSGLDITHNVARQMGLSISYQPSSLVEQMIAKQNINQSIN